MNERAELLRRIEQYSEDVYFANWYMGIEYIIWAKIRHGDTDPDILKIRDLAISTQGFFTWNDEFDDPVFIKLDDWIKEAGRMTPYPIAVIPQS